LEGLRSSASAVPDLGTVPETNPNIANRISAICRVRETPQTPHFECVSHTPTLNRQIAGADGYFDSLGKFRADWRSLADYGADRSFFDFSGSSADA
jgi:hypothetical protein